MKHKIRVTVGEPEKTAAGFAAAWRRTERSKGPIRPEESLCFESLEQLLALLTPRRLDLLRALAARGPMSVRALAKLVARDYKNVHASVKALEGAGLVTRTADGRLSMPWASIVAEVRFAA
jgi:predicted transcriptional regulator